jgi:molecular chaperone GrpE (heat shock protein)
VIAGNVNPTDPSPIPPDEPLTDFGEPHGSVSPATAPPPGSSTHDPDRSALPAPPRADQTPSIRADDAVAEAEDRDDADTLPDEETEWLAEWKSRLRDDFERWLSTVDEVPLVRESELEAGDPPDLYAFFEQLAVLNTESRRANRRTAEAVSQWNESLARFGDELERVRDLATQSLTAQGPAERLSRKHCLVLVEVLDRLQRLAAAFTATPRRPWFGGDGAWRRAWENQRQAFRIVLQHLEAFLRKEGVTPLETLGQAFDPHQMTAVAVETTSRQPPQTVLEEAAPGYLWNGELLRAAQVKIAVPLPNP